MFMRPLLLLTLTGLLSCDQGEPPQAAAPIAAPQSDVFTNTRPANAADLAEVKAAAADLAAKAAEQILAARLAGGAKDPLLDAAIAQIGDRLN